MLYFSKDFVSYGVHIKSYTMPRNAPPDYGFDSNYHLKYVDESNQNNECLISSISIVAILGNGNLTFPSYQYWQNNTTNPVYKAFVNEPIIQFSPNNNPVEQLTNKFTGESIFEYSV